MSLPKLVIAGAPKSGTTSLYMWLAAHPAVVTAGVKETYYLIDSGYKLFQYNANYLSGGLSGYSKIFPECKPGQLCIEATPDYMYQQTALDVLSSLPTQPLIVFILRNPVERVLSLRRFAQNTVGSMEHDVSINEFIRRLLSGTESDDHILDNALLHGEYHIWLERWIHVCGKARIETVFFEDMVNDPYECMKNLCELTGIDSGFYKKFKFVPKNQSLRVRSSKLLKLKNHIERTLPVLIGSEWLKMAYRMLNIHPVSEMMESSDSAVMSELQEYFIEPNRKLAQLLERELPDSWQRD